jgi:glutathione S-transferase
MKLYYSPGACSLSPHIVAREAGLPVELSRVTFDGLKRTTAEAEDFFVVNPRGGYVPALRLDDDSVLIEGGAIIAYLADKAGKLAPERGSQAYFDMLSWVIFVGTELHKGFSPLFNPALSEEQKMATIDKLKKRMAVLEERLAGREYIMGDFTIADAYAYTIMRWVPKRMNMGYEAFPNIAAFMKRMETRDGVKTALKEEELDPLG